MPRTVLVLNFNTFYLNHLCALSINYLLILKEKVKVAYNNFIKITIITALFTIVLHILLSRLSEWHSFPCTVVTLLFAGGVNAPGTTATKTFKGAGATI